MSFREPQTPGIGLTGQFTNAEFNAILALLASGGGSSLLYEKPAGLVNGVNTSFTVSNTPLFIEVSGQVMVSQTVDATNYGFTYSNGTVTFLSAPQPGQTPHSFYSGSTGAAVATFFTTDTFTTTANQTVFTTTANVLFLIDFVVNNQPQDTTMYTFNGTTQYTLNSGVPANLAAYIRYIHA